MSVQNPENDETLCQICFESTDLVVLNPCTHNTVCRSCVTKLNPQICPYDRIPIQSFESKITSKAHTHCNAKTTTVTKNTIPLAKEHPKETTKKKQKKSRTTHSIIRSDPDEYYDDIQDFDSFMDNKLVHFPSWNQQIGPQIKRSLC